MILNLLTQTDIRANATYFDNANGHATWTHPAMKENFQLDHFMVSRAHCKYVTDIKKKCIGAPSDHLPLFLKFKNKEKKKKLSNKTKNFIKTKNFKIDNSILRQNGNGTFKDQVANFIEKNIEEDNAKLSSSELLKNLKNM